MFLKLDDGMNWEWSLSNRRLNRYRLPMQHGRNSNAQDKRPPSRSGERHQKLLLVE